MRRPSHRPLPFLLLIVLLLPACQDAPLRVETSEGVDEAVADVEPESEEDLEERIDDLIQQLFPKPGLRRAATRQFRNVVRQLERGEVEDAREKVVDLVEFARSTFEDGQLLDPVDATTEEALAELIDLLLAFVGIDGAAAVVGPSGGQVVTADEDAAIDVPPGAVDEETVVLIRRIDVADPADCLPTARPQREGCYEFDTNPPTTFNVDVTVEICFDATGLTEEQEDRARLYQFDQGDPNVRALPNAPTSLVDCSDFVASAETNPLVKLAKTGWAGFRDLVGPWFAPSSLHAADLGLGGFTRSFSRIGWAGSSVLIYGPSLTPLDRLVNQGTPEDPDFQPVPFRNDNEETLAAADGHFVTVVDGPTWAGMPATGIGGFGDHDVLVFGDGEGSLADAASNASVWGGVVTGPVVVSALHPGVHQCDLAFVTCQNVVPQQFHNPEARTFIRQAINWAGQGRTTGAYVGLDTHFEAAGDPPGTPIAFLDGIADFDALGFDPNVTFGSQEDDVVLADPDHPVLAGIDAAGLSGWFLSYHQLLASAPPGFATIAEGWRRVDPSNPNDPLVAFPIVVVRPGTGNGS